MMHKILKTAVIILFITGIGITINGCSLFKKKCQTCPSFSQNTTGADTIFLSKPVLADHCSNN
jgi:hypothetical protein